MIGNMKLFGKTVFEGGMGEKGNSSFFHIWKGM